MRESKQHSVCKESVIINFKTNKSLYKNLIRIFFQEKHVEDKTSTRPPIKITLKKNVPKHKDKLNKNKENFECINGKQKLEVSKNLKIFKMMTIQYF